MKLLITFLTQMCLIFLVQALSNEQKQKITKYSFQCLAQTKANIALVRKLQNGKVVNDPKVHAFVFCLLKLCEVVDGRGFPRPDVIKEELSNDIPLDIITQVLSKCKPTASTPQQRAVELFKCYWDMLPVHIH